MTYLSGRQFQKAVRFPVNAGHPERSQSGPNLDHPQASIERDHVDRKQHTKRMNAAGRPDEESASGVEPPPPHQTDQALEGRVGDGYTRTDRGRARSVSQLDFWARNDPGSLKPESSERAGSDHGTACGPSWPGPHMRPRRPRHSSTFGGEKMILVFSLQNHSTPFRPDHGCESSVRSSRAFCGKSRKRVQRLPKHPR
jgi:hypothetical protein